jgi:hypothetical protein
MPPPSPHKPRRVPSAVCRIGLPTIATAQLQTRSATGSKPVQMDQQFYAFSSSLVASAEQSARHAVRKLDRNCSSVGCAIANATSGASAISTSRLWWHECRSASAPDRAFHTASGPGVVYPPSSSHQRAAVGRASLVDNDSSAPSPFDVTSAPA